MSGKRWINKEIKILIREFPNRWTKIPYLKRSRRAVQNKANRLNLKTKNRLWNPVDEKRLIKNYYQQGSKTLTNHSISSIKQHARKLGLKFFCDTPKLNFFTKLHPESAYVLGFIWADGSLNKANQLRIDQKEQKILAKILQVMDSKQKIKSYYRKTKNSLEFYITFNQKSLIKDLKTLGLHKNKTKTLKFPRFLPSALYPHFVRGFFDGDGSIWWHKRDKTFEASFCFASKKLASYLFKVLSNFNPTLSQIKNKQFWSLRLSRCVIIPFGNWMYKNSTIHLDRKYQKFKLAGCRL